MIIKSNSCYMLRNDGVILQITNEDIGIKNSRRIIHPYLRKYQQNHKYYINDWEKNWFIKYSNNIYVKTHMYNKNLTNEEFDKVYNILNAEFCRIRTDDLKFNSNKQNETIFFRISDDNSDWNDLIWKVILDNKNQYKYVTICNDDETLHNNNFRKIKNKEINFMPINEFLTLW